MQVFRKLVHPAPVLSGLLLQNIQPLPHGSGSLHQTPLYSRPVLKPETLRYRIQTAFRYQAWLLPFVGKLRSGEPHGFPAREPSGDLQLSPHGGDDAYQRAYLHVLLSFHFRNGWLGDIQEFGQILLRKT